MRRQHDAASAPRAVIASRGPSPAGGNRVDGEQLAQLGLVRAIETSMLERLEQLVGRTEHGLLVPGAFARPGAFPYDVG